MACHLTVFLKYGQVDFFKASDSFLTLIFLEKKFAHMHPTFVLTSASCTFVMAQQMAKHWKQILGIDSIVFEDHVCIQVVHGSKKNIHTEPKEQSPAENFLFIYVCGKLVAFFVLIQNTLFKIGVQFSAEK